jgi:hypothetical protein
MASLLANHPHDKHLRLPGFFAGPNIIDDVGNPSDGLRFLDMTYSDGLSLAAAIANAQATYANARLATASEFDDLFSAAGIV